MKWGMRERARNATLVMGRAFKASEFEAYTSYLTFKICCERQGNCNKNVIYNNFIYVTFLLHNPICSGVGGVVSLRSRIG